jgi:hypothetical protein
MAHSHDKTLLARFGFSDPDKRGGLHDDLCAFLVDPSIAPQVLATVLAQRGLLPEGPTCGEDVAPSLSAPFSPCGAPVRRFVRLTSAKTEVVIQKGEGKYASLVGFADALASCVISHVCPLHKEHHVARADVYFEAKAYAVSAAELLRQVNLYRSVVGEGSTSHRRLWAAFTAFAYSASDVAMLHREGLTVLRAGPRFQAWQTARASAVGDQGAEL